MTLKREASRDQARLGEVAWRVNDTENRARRNNLRFVGFPEGAEKMDCSGFLEKWLLGLFGAEKFSPFCHRKGNIWP